MLLGLPTGRGCLTPGVGMLEAARKQRAKASRKTKKTGASTAKKVCYLVSLKTDRPLAGRSGRPNAEARSQIKRAKAAAIRQFKAELNALLVEHQLSIINEMKTLGIVCISCTPAVAKLVEELPSVSAINKMEKKFAKALKQS